MPKLVLDKPTRFAFFGTPDIAVLALEELKTHGLIPSLVVTTPDKPKGRGLVLTPPPVKVWAEAHNIPVLQPTKLSDADFLSNLKTESYDLFVIVAYGKIIPKEVLSLPRLGTLNMHPSLLPKHRGPSPIESQILSEKSSRDVGVSIMLLDEEMDHGPVLAQKNMTGVLQRWPIGARAAYIVFGKMGGALLAETLPRFASGEIHPIAQEHGQATFSKKITTEDAQINLADNPEENYRKILAYEASSRAYFFTKKNGSDIRVIITDAELLDGALAITKVIPAGKKEMTFEEFTRG
ncbi:MAG: methionyl-tRNA formyltransferase [Patescibacteria group bacterium]